MNSQSLFCNGTEIASFKDSLTDVENLHLNTACLFREKTM